MPIRIPPPRPRRGLSWSQGEAWLDDVSDLLRSVIVDEESPSRYESLSSQIHETATGSATIATFEGLDFYHFGADVEQSLSFRLSLPHRWKEGTLITPYIRWASTNTDTGAVRWEIAYRFADTGAVLSSISTRTADQNAIGVAGTLQLTLFSEINCSGQHIGCTIVGAVSRLAAAAEDTCLDDAILFDVGFNVLMDINRGSQRQWTKWT